MPNWIPPRVTPLACVAAAFITSGAVHAQLGPGEPIRLRYAEFAPTHFTPAVPMNLRSAGAPGVYIVQLQEHTNSATMAALH